MREIFKKSLGPIILFVAIVCILNWNEQRENRQIESNRATSIAQVINIGRRSKLSYRFLYNEKWYTGYGNGITNTSEKDYYQVEFDKTNPTNSNLILTKKSISPLDLIDDGIEIKGKIEKLISPSKNYVDLYIDYHFIGEKYSFRTRMHKDSLPCGDVSECEKSSINIRISTYFPNLNNLYYESYDRSSIRKKINEKFKK